MLRPGTAPARLLTILASGLATFAGLDVARTAPAAVDIHEWTVPWADTRPRDPDLDAKGRVWFVGQVGHYLAWLDPSAEKFERIPLEAGTGPHNLVVAGDGAVWFSGNLKGYIGRLDPATGAIKRFPMPDPEAKDPHTLIFGRNGELWFTVQAGSFVGRLDPKSGTVRLVKIPTPGARPYGIALDSKGRPFFNEFGTAKLGTLDPATLALKEYALPEGARGRRIAITSDDKVWYVDYGRGKLARLDPASGKVDEWAAPSGEQSLPYAMANDDRDRLWFVETGPQPNRLVGFDPKTSTYFANAPIAGGGGTVRHMVFVRAGRELWFGTDKNTIGRARIP